MSLFVTLHIHIESGRITCVSVGHLAFPVSASCQKNHSTKKLDADLQHHLVGGVEHDFYFSIHIGNVLIPTDFNSIIFQRGGLKPPTRLIHRILMDIYTILIYPGYIYISGWWFGTFFIFPYIGNFIIPTDFHIFQRVETTNQIYTPFIYIIYIHHLYTYIYTHHL
jgi:hypothetical protein